MIPHYLSDLNAPQWTRRLLALVLGVSLLLTVWSLSSYLWDRYRVVRDVQNFYWMARAQDPALFATDYLYISSNYIVEVDILGFHLLLYPLSLGYGLLFYLASVVIDYVWLTKLSVWVLVPLCVIYLFKLGKWLEGNLTGVSLSLIFVFFILASPLSISIVSGLQRAFSVPIFIAFLYYLIRQQYGGAALMIFLSTLIYLPNFPPMVLAYALSFVNLRRPIRLSLSVTRSKLMPLAVALLLSALIVAPALAVQLGLLPASAPAVFSSDTLEDVPASRISENPAYQSGGSMPLFFVFGFPFWGRAGIFDTGGDAVNFLVMLVFAFLIYKVVGPLSLQRMPGALWHLLASGVIMYAVSLFFVLGLSSFALYLPSRYTRGTLFLVALFFVGLNWVDFLGKLPGWLRRNARLLIFFFISFGLGLAAVHAFSPDRLLVVPLLWLVGLILSGIWALLGGSSLFWLATGNLTLKNVARWSILLAVGVIVVSLGTVYIRILGVKIANPSEHERGIYEFVASLPKDTVLAGDPDIMTNIPLFSKRSVLFREKFPRPAAPIVEYFDAHYAETPETILGFCQRYQVSYLVVDTRDFAPDYLAEGDFFYQPWNDRIVEMIAGRSSFVLPQLQPVFASGPFTVIQCDAETILADN